MSFGKKLKEKISSYLYYPPRIEREVVVNGKTIEAKYDPVNGEFKFFNKEGEPYELNGAGAFRVLDTVFEAFKDVDMKKISYDLNKSDDRLETKEKFYARFLRAHGYTEKRFTQKKSIWQHHHTWVKKREKSSGLERRVAVASIIALIFGAFLLFPIITGNVVASLTLRKTHLIGGSLLILGLLLGLVWLKIVKK